MDRREFFRRSAGKLADKAVQEVEARAVQRASHWLRPPYAKPELDFLLSCTRCSACIEACPHHTIFPLASRLGADVVGTPALDLLNRACHLCDDWPCVTSCEPKALQLPETADDEVLPLPQLAQAKIDTEHCLPYLGPECGACAGSCPLPDALHWDCERPVITASCVGCGLCREVCILEPKAIQISALTQDKKAR